MSTKKAQTSTSAHGASPTPQIYEWTPPSSTRSHPVLTFYVDPMLPAAVMTPHADVLARQAGTDVIEVAEEAARKGKPIQDQVVLVADLNDPTARQLARVALGDRVDGKTGIVTFERLVSTLRRAPFGPREVAEAFFTSSRPGRIRVMVLTDGHWYPSHFGLRHAGNA